jgi:hypothetical protein
VSDQGFDFQGPPPRRQPRPFEPPPWEKDQFEQRAREQAERERAEKEAAGVAAEAQAAALEQPAPEGSAAVEADRPTPQQGSDGQARPSTGAKAALDERQVELMMLGLREEEPKTLSKAWFVSFVAGAIVGLVGLTITVWGAAALFNSKLGEAGKLGGMVMVVFGLAFFGIGGWLIYGALRQRGVL